MGLWQSPSSPHSRPLFPALRRYLVPILMLLQCCLKIRPGRDRCRPDIKIKIKINPRKGKVGQHLFYAFTPSPPPPLGHKLTVRLQSVNTELPKKLDDKREDGKSGKDMRSNEGLWQPTAHGEPRLLDWRHGATVDSRRCDA